jgi:hypothetical protein
MVDHYEIHKKLRENFSFRGSVDLNDDGSIDSGEDISMTSSIGHIPVTFNEINGSFYVISCKLSSLVGSPKKVGGRYDCNDNLINSLEGGPIEVGMQYDCTYNRQLTSLEGFPKVVGSQMLISWNSNLHMLRLMTLDRPAYITGCNTLNMDPVNPENIYAEIFSYKKKEIGLKAAIWQFQKELVNNGFEKNAVW